jgi:hypothetical protein
MRPPARPAGLGTISAFNERHFRASVDGSLQRNIHILHEVRWKIKLGHDIDVIGASLSPTIAGEFC